MATNNPNPPEIPASRIGIMARRARPFVLVALAAGLAALVLYGQKPLESKKTEQSQTQLAQVCPATAAAQAAARPLAKGAVAAFIVGSSAKPAPEVSFSSDNGPRRLRDWRGKTVLVNLWATWCAPCRQEMPALNQLQARLGGPNFDVVAINVDTARLERPKIFLADNQLDHLTFYADPNGDILRVLRQDNLAQGLPTTLLIGSDGCLIGALGGPAQWDGPEARALIEAVLKY